MVGECLQLLMRSVEATQLNSIHGRVLGYRLWVLRGQALSHYAGIAISEMASAGAARSLWPA